MFALAPLAKECDVRGDVLVALDDGLLSKPKLFHDVIRVCHFMLSNISSGVAMPSDFFNDRVIHAQNPVHPNVNYVRLAQ